jgi:uncharacterized membrane protein YedE/YeeE
MSVPRLDTGYQGNDDMITSFTPLSGLVGGLLLGLSAVLLMASAGRTAGASGIFGGLITMKFDGEFSWRAAFMLGLLAGCLLAVLVGAFDRTTFALSSGPTLTIASGLLVGFGTAMGSGCTSGHGVCGVSRLSKRSITATVIFMAVSIATVTVMRHVVGG